MKTQTISILLLALAALPAMAQETYQDTKLVENELNGTARYVGMGGAMEALGADISTISTNPAGIGLFRKNQVTVSGGLVTQGGDATTSPSFNGIQLNYSGQKTHASFDQIGFVWAHRVSSRSYLNFGFSYHKSRNFDQILNAGGKLDNASQNKLSAIKYALGVGDNAWNAVDANYQEMFQTADGKDMEYRNATQYLYGQYQHGYIGEYDFNFSGNINDRVYLGITLGIHDVNYRSNSIYSEDLEGNAYSLAEELLKIDGTGYDVKLGAIFRPFAYSPFRIGVYVNSPVFYSLTQYGTSGIGLGTLYSDGSTTDEGTYSENSASLDYKVNTPWKFGISLGHTIGNSLALGATYEYSDYSTIDNRYIDGGYYDAYYGQWYDSSSSDNAMNHNTKQTLKGVSLLKLGAEYKFTPKWALRVGYNYQSPIFKSEGFRDGSIESQGVAYATSTDFTNWKATNRFTCGLGYQYKGFTVDLAYQYTQTDGDFYPFMSYYASESEPQEMNNQVSSTPVSFKRSQVLLTLGYRF